MASTEQKDSQTLQQAKGSVATAQQQVTEAQASFLAAKSSQPGTLAADKATLASAESSLTQAEQDLSDATLRAPVSGTVVSLALSKGASVSAGNTTVVSSSQLLTGSSSSSSSSSSGSGSSPSSSTEVVIEPANAYVILVEADSSQIGDIRDGEQAVITPTGSATTTDYGIVTSFSTSGTTSSGVTQFPVVVAVTGSSSGLYAGATANVDIITKQVNNVLVVPTSAVHTVGSTSYVEVLKKGKESRQVIGVGASSGTETQVTSGLKSGQQVVIAALRASSGSSGNSTSGFPGGGSVRFGGGGFGGGGFGGGGFGGAGFAGRGG
jgi:multidrug efflux pump subunit AcrA (membrane-fusion protein)